MSTLRKLDSQLRPLWSPRRLVALAFILGCLLAGLVLVGAYSVSQSLANCQRTQRIDIVVQQLGERGLKTIGTKGSPGFAYYRDHPDELRIAREQLQQQVNDFTPGKCSL